MDDADQAQSIDELALAVALRGVKVPMGRNEGLTCLACGNDIPAGRRRAIEGCELCVDCQGRLERGMGR
jgi:phage/conjugal plasmid C-4 type zinc finger TraR family protein